MYMPNIVVLQQLKVISRSLPLIYFYAVQKFHQYLYGYQFVLVTDHKPLTTKESASFLN